MKAHRGISSTEIKYASCNWRCFLHPGPYYGQCTCVCNNFKEEFLYCNTECLTINKRDNIWRAFQQMCSGLEDDHLM